MFPPKPTNDPYQLLSNMHASLVRASADHWTMQATIEPAESGVGYRATFQCAQRLPPEQWKMASTYMKGYARASHWKVHGVANRGSYAEMYIEQAPPKPKSQSRLGQRPASQKTE